MSDCQERIAGYSRYRLVVFDCQIELEKKLMPVLWFDVKPQRGSRLKSIFIHSTNLDWRNKLSPMHSISMLCRPGVRTQIITKFQDGLPFQVTAYSALEGEIAGWRDDIMAGSLLPTHGRKSNLIGSGTQNDELLEDAVQADVRLSWSEDQKVRIPPVPVRPGGSGTSEFLAPERYIVDQQDFAGCKSHSATS
jgi:hypothetical protein